MEYILEPVSFSRVTEELTESVDSVQPVTVEKQEQADMSVTEEHTKNCNNYYFHKKMLALKEYMKNCSNPHPQMPLVHWKT
jgi:hypothetical protein